MRIRRFSKPLTIALDSGVYDRVKQITDVQARSMADWVREAVDEALCRPNAEQADMTKQSSVNGGK
jgi:predicted transcriptional regulator